jgi:hypothetical protein
MCTWDSTRSFAYIPVHNPERVAEAWMELPELFAPCRQKSVVFNRKYTLETLTQELQDIEDRKTWGKAVI